MTQSNRIHAVAGFARHYVEMIAVMFFGMFALGMPADGALHALGASTSSGHTATMLIEMAVTMTVPMVAWMQYRGHSWRANAEMAASMLVPTAGVLVLLWSGVATGAGTLMVVEHAAMLACMLAAMLLRRDEYAHPHGTCPVAA